MGNGLPATTLFGRGSSTGGAGGGGVGWAFGSGGVEVRFLLTDSTREPRAGNFLFLSIAEDCCSSALDGVVVAFTKEEFVEVVTF